MLSERRGRREGGAAAASMDKVEELDGGGRGCAPAGGSGGGGAVGIGIWEGKYSKPTRPIGGKARGPPQRERVGGEQQKAQAQ
jgi:hypothetical protein